MTLSTALLSRLILRAERARKETFELEAEAWNLAVETYARSRPLIVRGARPGGWLHPWEMSVAFDGARKQWRARINPGFVSGIDALVRVDREIAPTETLARLGSGASLSVDAHLTEEPEIEIPLGLLRAIGPDAEATGAVSNGLSSRVTFEPVPEYFQALGVGDPPEQSVDALGGVKIGSDFLNQESLGARRLLRALDVTLTKDRPATVAQWTTSGGINGTVAQFDVTYASAVGIEARARIGFTPKHEPDATSPQDTFARITGAAPDSAPFDRLHLATIYFMSPPGEKPGAPVSPEWQSFVRHRVFWNLNHALNRLPVRSQGDNLTFSTPLGGAVGNALINSYLAGNNDAFDAANEFYNARVLEGRFWST